MERLDQSEGTIEQTDSGEVILQGWDQSGLYIFWNKSREIESQYLDKVEQSAFAIIHDDYFRKIRHEVFQVVKPYFRIKHECRDISDYCLDERFSVVNVDTKVELEKVSELIGKCYKDIHPSVDTVSQWTRYDVFDENLWIWIVEKETNMPIALGIAELDDSVSEGSLEWIQILPGYQGKGLGKVLVLELLNRMCGKVGFVTVSGESNNETNPERLYKSCGFSGNDTWWLLRK